MRIFWQRIRICDGVSKAELVRATKVAKKHPIGQLPHLTFTEANPEWVLLYEHAQKGQITSETLRYMRRRDLYYLAGMTFPHPGLMQAKSDLEKNHPYLLSDSENRWDRVTKLQGNAARAKIELDRRNFVWASSITIIAALAGGYIGSVLGH